LASLHIIFNTCEKITFAFGKHDYWGGTGAAPGQVSSKKPLQMDSGGSRLKIFFITKATFSN